MKKQDYLNVGVRGDCLDEAMLCVKNAARAGRFKGVVARKLVKDVAGDPAAFANDEHFGPLARKLMEPLPEPPRRDPIPYATWGTDIDDASRAQMRDACALPVARAAALMPDAHVGYGLPIGGVLATENAVIPYAVGVDIACRMKLSVLDVPVASLEKELRGGAVRRGDKLSEALEEGTRFGVGSSWDPRHEHPVMDLDWSVSPVTKALKDRAWSQLGTSGSGNHFVELGVLTLHARPDDPAAFPLEPGRYLALLSHSGSRGTGAAVCSEYSGQATARLGPRDRERYGRLAWLSLDTQEGQEYWRAMNLMGEYARANHACIHRAVAELLGAQILAGVENHHNFAWKEVHGGRELIVHRKGATPAGKGVLGVIPGSMADPCFVVQGKGNPASLDSAAHGAGRRLSRTEAKRRFNWAEWRAVLKQRGVRLLSAGLDEVPGAYKPIQEVMAAQADLVDVIAQFDPRIVKMSDDGRSED